MRITFLGTGTSYGVPVIACHCEVCESTDPRDTRLRPSVCLEFDEGPTVLIDTATDLRAQALRFRVERVDAVLYTHSHADHIFGFDELRRFNHLSHQPIPAFGDARTMADLTRTFAYAFDPATDVGGGLPQVVPSIVTGPFALGGHEVVPVPIVHGQRPILGYRVGRFAYLTDCSAIPEDSYALLDGLDVVVIGALRWCRHPTHFSIDEAVAAAARIGAERAFLTHMCHDLGHAATNAVLPDGVQLAHDGLVLEV